MYHEITNRINKAHFQALELFPTDKKKTCSPGGPPAKHPKS